MSMSNKSTNVRTASEAFQESDDFVNFQAAHFDLPKSLPYSKLHKLNMDGIKQEMLNLYRDFLLVKTAADLQLLNEDYSLVTLKDIIPGATIVVTNVPHSLFAFWKNLHLAILATDAETNATTLSLIEQATFNNLPAYGSTMLVRKAYIDLTKLVFDILGSGTNILMTGTPGIGKSLFVFYLCYRILQDNPQSTIIFHDNNQPGNLVKIKNRMVTCGSFLLDLTHHDTWYVADGCTPSWQSVKAKTILVTSPKREIYHRWQKHVKHLKLYMPTWSFEEMEICWKLLYKDARSARDVFTFDKLQERWLSYGGVPRAVLFNWEKSIEAHLEATLERSKLEEALSALGKRGIKDGVSDVIVHFEVEENYLGFHYCAASERISQEILKDFERQGQEALRNFILAAEDLPGFASVRGKFFEAFAHKILPRGSNPRIRSLDDGSTQELNIPQLPVERFQKIADIKTGCYNVPLSKNFAAVDAVIPQVALLQMTVSNNHRVSVKGLNQLSEFETHDLIFVVPSDRFDSFQRQTYQTAKGQPFIGNLPEFVASVKQWVLKLDF